MVSVDQCGSAGVDGDSPNELTQGFVLGADISGLRLECKDSDDKIDEPINEAEFNVNELTQSQTLGIVETAALDLWIFTGSEFRPEA